MRRGARGLRKLSLHLTVIRHHPVLKVTLAWHGGEPTLMGLDFYRRSVEVQKSYSTAPGRQTGQKRGLFRREWQQVPEVPRIAGAVAVARRGWARAPGQRPFCQMTV